MTKLNPRIEKGFVCLTIGLAKKVLIANQVHYLSDYIFLYDGHDTITALTGLLSFGVEIYFDFSGYTDIALGLGLILGIQLPQNFRSPFRAKSMRDYWRRWHMTLSDWFRDYMYIPLGGNRKGKAREVFNIAFVMITCGFWHGAKWNYLIWGSLMAIYFILEKVLFSDTFKNSKDYPFITMSYIFLLWLPFRATDLGQIQRYLYNIFNWAEFENIQILEMILWQHAIALIGGLFIIFKVKRTQQWIEDLSPKLFGGFVVLFLYVVTEAFSDNYRPFIYFDF